MVFKKKPKATPMERDLASLNLKQQEKAPLHPYASIPERVTQHVPLAVQESTITTKRANERGIFVMEPVKAGSLVFSIKKPFILVSDPKFKDTDCTTCDHCMKSLYQPEGKTVYQNTFPDDSGLDRCPGCLSVFYCLQEVKKNTGNDKKVQETINGKAGDKKPESHSLCQKEAWDEYHKHECKALDAHLKWLVEGNRTNLCHEKCFRATLRYCTLLNQSSASVRKSIREEVRSLRTRPVAQAETKVFMDTSRVNCQKILDGVGHVPGGAVIKDLTDFYYLVPKVDFEIKMPTLMLNICKIALPQPINLDDGTCIEPFASLINHSCEPNVTWYMEGTEIRVVALNDIPAKAEIFAAYITTIECLDKIYLREEIYQKWGFYCKCNRCKVGDPWPRGLRHVALALFTGIGTVSDREFMELIVSTWRKNAALGISVLQRNFADHIQRNDISAAIRALLEMLDHLYQGVPKRCTFFGSEASLMTLAVLIQILRHFILEKKKLPEMHYPKARRAHGHIDQTLPSMYMELKDLYARGCYRLYGEDSVMYKYAAKSLAADNYDDKYSSLFGDAHVADLFLEDWNNALAWADGKWITMEDVLGPKV